MKKILLSTIICLVTILSVNGQANENTNKQIEQKKIDRLQDQYQGCLDNGKNMSGCSIMFYRQMDSMLNVVYNKLRLSLNPEQQTSLAKEQTNWLAKRDSYFKRTLGKLKKVNRLRAAKGMPVNSKDDMMLMYEANGEFVKLRGVALIKTLNN